jgi:hypothetical protein
VKSLTIIVVLSIPPFSYVILFWPIYFGALLGLYTKCIDLKSELTLLFYVMSLVIYSNFIFSGIYLV